jgi:hypothetical protein
MPLTALLLAVLATPTAEEPASVPQEQPAPIVRYSIRAYSLSVGASQGSLYGLRLLGAGLHASMGNRIAGPDPGSTWGWDLGLGLGRTSTPAGLAVTDVAVDLALHLGLGPVRVGAGAELRAIDMERATAGGGDMIDVRVDAVAFLSVDVFRFSGGTMAYLEARGYGLASLAWMAHLGAGVRF